MSLDPLAAVRLAGILSRVVIGLTVRSLILKGYRVNPFLQQKPMSIVIPDDILQAAKMTEAELKLEIAIMLYGQEKISSGKVRNWTGLTVIEFQHELAKRQLWINYDVDDFQSDIKTLQSIGLL
jgi:predicted HTH domain antitoxin